MKVRDVNYFDDADVHFYFFSIFVLVNTFLTYMTRLRQKLSTSPLMVLTGFECMLRANLISG